MNRKTLCIVIALMVLSISALIVANPNILGGFSSTVNGVPVQVTISRQDNGTITTMRTADLMKNWADHNRRFVRFIGTVEFVFTSLEMASVRLELYLGDGGKMGDGLTVFPLDAPHLPTVYQEWHVYEFTGFLVGPDVDVIDNLADRMIGLHVHAFEIRHHGPEPRPKPKPSIQTFPSGD